MLSEKALPFMSSDVLLNHSETSDANNAVDVQINKITTSFCPMRVFVLIGFTVLFSQKFCRKPTRLAFIKFKTPSEAT